MNSQSNSTNPIVGQEQVEQVKKVNRRRVDSIVVYEITEPELDELVSGNATNHLFEAFIATLSIGLSFLASILASSLEVVRLTIFIVVAVGSFMASAVFAYLWFIFRRDKASISDKIKARVQDVKDSASTDATSKE